jgi:hypothetical protein
VPSWVPHALSSPSTAMPTNTCARPDARRWP